MVVRSILLGLVVFGGLLGEMLEISCKFYVKFEMFVDLIDFWKMEIMGVVVKFCVCEVDKFI